MVHEGMRAGDADRQRVADQLKTALDEGRLDLGEYDERLQRTYAAKTFKDLDGLLDDLPGTVPVRKSQVEPHHAAPVHHGAPSGHEDGGRSKGLGGMVGVFLVCTLVWAMTSLSSGHVQYFWPGWVLIPVVLALVAHLGDRNKRRH
ncbi:DUF1707 domain-containing protein [Actinoplanes sp. GCM10030250]|uniref:DUF1707 SHOCT-like domain-containing protein n=1 Tax=Actinoplanes sp. GCM10030250 TaxID=3273376 RepID=UPI003616804B